MPTIQGGISFESLKQDADFMAAPEVDQIQYLNEVFLPKSDPDFAKAPLAERQQYIKEAVLPNLKTQGLSTQPQASPMGGFQNVANQINQAVQPVKDIQNAFFASNLYNNAQALKGATAGYVDLAPSVEQFVGPVPQPVKDLGWLPEFGGMALPLGGISKGVKAASIGLGSGLPAQALRAAADLGIYEALRRREDAPVFSQQQLDPMGRLQSGLQGAVTGAAFPLVGGLLGKGASKFAQLFNPESAPLRVASSKEAELAAKAADQAAKFDKAKNFMQLYVKAFQEAEQANPTALRYNPISKAQRLNVHNSLEDLARQAQNGQVELSDKEIAYLAGKLKAFRSDTVSKGQINASKSFLKNIQKRQESLINEQKAKIQLTEGQPNAQGTQKTGALNGIVEQTQGQGPLTGRVETTSPFTALEDKAAKPTGKTAQELLDAKPSDLNQAEQDVRANLKAVRNAEVIDAQQGILKQYAINEKTDLPYEAIAHLVEDKVLGSKLEEVAKGDLSGRIEYQAEIVGRSDKAVTVTKAGNVKSATTTFGPKSFGISTRIENVEDIPVNPKTGKPYGKDSKVVQGLIEDGTLKVKQYPLAKGYNEQGHFVTLHINKSPEGSQILKVGKVIDSHFNGEYANVYAGPKEFKAADVLNRGARTESGFVKTSEAIEYVKEFQQTFNEDFLAKMPKHIQGIMRSMLKRKQMSSTEINKIKQLLEGNQKALKAFCELMGMK